MIDLDMAESAGVANEEMIGFQKGYVRAYQEIIDEHEVDMECATHMETICPKCGKTFKLDMMSVTLGHESDPPYPMCAVITCPHCKKGKEI